MPSDSPATAARRRGVPRWRWIVLLQLWLLLAAAGLFAAWGDVAPMIFCTVAFILGHIAATLIADQEDHGAR